MVTNHPAGTATYTDIIKKTVARALGRMLPAKVSMDWYWPKQKQSPVVEDKDNHETQGAVGEMYTGNLASVLSGF